MFLVHCPAILGVTTRRRGASPRHGPANRFARHQIFLYCSYAIGGKTRVLAVRHNGVRRLPKGNLKNSWQKIMLM